MALFLYGTLRFGALFARIAGQGDATARMLPARLDGHAVDRVQGTELPMLVARPGATVEGQVWLGLTAAQMARINAYEVPFGYVARPVMVATTEGTIAATAYFPPAGHMSSDEGWSPDRWHVHEGAAAVLAAEEIAAHDPPLEPADLARQWHMIGARAHSAARAEATHAPATLRHAAGPGDHRWTHARPLAGAFFKLAAMDMDHRRFDGTTAQGLRREVLVGVDAALLLPYDPARDRVLLVEQFRTGPARRGDTNPWTLEPVAGIIDAGETPEVAAVRECGEEAGLVPRAIEKMFAFYASPGSSTDYFHCFLGLADLPDGHAGFGGLEAESEDLRLHILPRADALGLIASGEVTAGPLIAMLLWLDRNHARFRQQG